MSQFERGFDLGSVLKSSKYSTFRSTGVHSSPGESKRSRGGPPGQVGTQSSGPKTDRSEPKPEGTKTDVNFASIVGLDAAGGWHILRISLDGSVTADAAACKVLRQFFSGDPGWAGGLPVALAECFFESRDWGMSRALSRSWKRFATISYGLKLTVHFIPDRDGGYIVLKTGPAIIRAEATALLLTDREQEVATLVTLGKTNGEIGLLLRISARTVQKHLENIFRKLGIETRTALAMRAITVELGSGS